MTVFSSRNLAALCAAGALVSLSLPASAAISEKDGLALAQKSGCLACHKLDQKLVGPSWKEVGKKYAGQKGAEAKLDEKVKKGGVGVWGKVPMPPNTKVSDADIKKLVEFVLSLK